MRAAVRRQDAVDTISRGPSVQKYLSTGALTFALVPDNTVPRAYREPAKGCSYIIHAASPLPTVAGDLVSQAVAGNKAILDAAEATPSMRRVVFTASTGSLSPFERLLLEHPANQALLSGRGDQVPALTAETKVPTQPPVPDEAPGFRRYKNSKIAAINLVHEYDAAHPHRQGSEPVHFSIVNLMPGWILGPEELARSKQEAFQGSNLILSWLFSKVSLAPLYGLAADDDVPLIAEMVHLDDVVESHVKALDTAQVPGKYRNFLLCSHGPAGPVMMDAAEIVRQGFPREVADGKIPFVGQLGKAFYFPPFSSFPVFWMIEPENAAHERLTGRGGFFLETRLGTIPGKFDASPTKRDLLGHRFRPFDEQVMDTVGWYLKLKD